MNREQLNQALRDAADEYHNAMIEMDNLDHYSHSREEALYARDRFQAAARKARDLAEAHSQLIARGE